VSITYLEAIREAQARLLREDDRVYIYGQDIAGKFGGAFKATKGLPEQFPGRVLNTPISEDAMIGTAIGAAIEGMRPIVEMQFADFSSIALNQILNNAGTHYYRTNIPVPITVRLPSGGTKGSGPFHSQSMEGLWQSTTRSSTASTSIFTTISKPTRCRRRTCRSAKRVSFGPVAISAS
jgi:pyruvate dehydrogenase E1 component beta subunit/2-oxoisovalerate dehydrogenase E1 component beta subunit